MASHNGGRPSKDDNNSEAMTTNKTLNGGPTLTAQDLIDWCGTRPWIDCLMNFEGDRGELALRWAKNLLDGYPNPAEVQHKIGISLKGSKMMLEMEKISHAERLIDGLEKLLGIELAKLDEAAETGDQRSGEGEA